MSDNFDIFLEYVSKNATKKSGGRPNRISYDDGVENKKIKDAYNTLNEVLKRAPTIGGGEYIVVYSKLLKMEGYERHTNEYWILHKKNAFDAMWNLYDKYKHNANEGAGEYHENGGDFLIDIRSALNDRKIKAASLDGEFEDVRGFGKVWTVGSASVDTKHQGKGLMLELYRALILGGTPLRSGSQSAGARLTWSRLGQTPGIKLFAMTHGSNPKVTPVEISKDGRFMAYVDIHDDVDYDMILARKA